jgi:hypothetical protein
MATKLLKHVLPGDNDSAFQAAIRLWKKAYSSTKERCANWEKI